MRPACALRLAALLLTGCVPPNEALHGATLSAEPGAPGYLVVGLAERNYRWDLATWTQSIALTFTSPGQQPVTVTRRGCGSITGLVGGKPCELSTVDYTVLQLPPGRWTPSAVREDYHWYDGDHSLQHTPDPADPLLVRPGQISYAGDYTFASNADTSSIQLLAHTRNDPAARHALAPYPNLRTATLTNAVP